MLAHMQLKFKTAELQQEEVLQVLPKAIRSSIAQHLFLNTVVKTYLFKGVTEDFTVQLVSEMKAEYFPPKVDIIIQNEVPTDFYIIVSGAVDVLIYKNGLEQQLMTLGPTDMAGETGVFFNIPQLFTMRSKRLSQVIRISHQRFKQMVQQHNQDGKTILSNFVQYLKGLKQEVLDEIPFLTDLLGDLTIEQTTSEEDHNYEASILSNNVDTNIEGIPVSFIRLASTFPTRVVIHGHPPNEKSMEGKNLGKLVHLPDSIEDLLKLAEKKFGKKGSTILMEDGSQVEDIGALRENDHLFIF